MKDLEEKQNCNRAFLAVGVTVLLTLSLFSVASVYSLNVQVSSLQDEIAALQSDSFQIDICHFHDLLITWVSPSIIAGIGRWVIHLDSVSVPPVLDSGFISHRNLWFPKRKEPTPLLQEKSRPSNQIHIRSATACVSLTLASVSIKPAYHSFWVSQAPPWHRHLIR